MDEDRFLLADPRLAVALLGTLRQDGDVLIDELDDPPQGRVWLDRVGLGGLDDTALAELQQFRDQLRTLFTAVTSGEAPPPSIIQALNRTAARDPVTLVARTTRGPTIRIERASTARGRTPAVLDG